MHLGWALRARWHQRPTKLRSDGGSGTISSGHRLTPYPGYANIGMYQRMKGLTWLADSRSRVKSFPAGVQDDIGYALYAAQLGERSPKAKPLHGLGGQVMEIAAYDASGTYRAIYTVSIGESIYVIHAFQKTIQGWNCDAEIGDGTDLPAAQTIEKRGEECRKEKPLNGSQVRATYSLTSACPTQANT